MEVPKCQIGVGKKVRKHDTGRWLGGACGRLADHWGKVEALLKTQALPGRLLVLPPGENLPVQPMPHPDSN